MFTSTYHAQTFKLLNIEPFYSLENEHLLHSIERELTITLPAAFHEWYTVAHTTQLLADYSNNDHPIPISKLGRPLARWLPYDPVKNGVLPFMVENQGVCTWAIRLNGQDDPAVLVEVDSGSPPQWQLCAEHFTDWVHLLIRDWLTLQQLRFQAQAIPLTEQDLTILGAAFQEIGRTYAWPGTINYRLHNAWGDLIIWAGSNQSDWFLCPLPDMEQALLTHLWQCANLRQSLYAMTEQDERYLE
jgi:hypothetical protein